MKEPKREWSNSDARSLIRGESHNHFGRENHPYQESEWYVWFLGNPTRFAMFFLFLQKYGEGEMVSYTDLTLTKKIGRVNLKIDSIKSTVRDGLEMGFIQSFKSNEDKRVTLYNFNPNIIQEITDYCFCMRRNRMGEAASYMHSNTTSKVNDELTKAATDEVVEAINSTIKITTKALNLQQGFKKSKKIMPFKK
jgi:hypothetical protein